MWTPLITLVALVRLTAAGAAAVVTLSASDAWRGNRALILLKLLLGAVLGSCGLIAAVIRPHQAGLL